MYDEYVSFRTLCLFFLSPDVVDLAATFFSAGAFDAGALAADGFFSATCFGGMIDD